MLFREESCALANQSTSRSSFKFKAHWQAAAKHCQCLFKFFCYRLAGQLLRVGRPSRTSTNFKSNFQRSTVEPTTCSGFPEHVFKDSSLLRALVVQSTSLSLSRIYLGFSVTSLHLLTHHSYVFWLPRARLHPYLGIFSSYIPSRPSHDHSRQDCRDEAFVGFIHDDVPLTSIGCC